MSEYLLEMKNITKSFGGVQALKNVSIDLKENEILALVGENGAGKSTLMKILSGSYSQSTYDGEIWVGGKKKTFNSPADSESAGIEMIYQEISAHLDLSVAENIFLGRIPVKNGIVQWKKMFRDAKTYAEMVGLHVSVHQPVRDLSTSQLQMVTIARALSRHPKILVLDEPTSALTEKEVEHLFENLFKLRDQGISCIYISHKIKEVMYLANRVTVLRDGCNISTNDIKEITADSIVEKMVNRKIVNMYPKEDVQIGEEVLRVENLVVPHPFNIGKNVVDNISFHVRKGEILGLVGLVGSGRSETVSAVVGALKAASKDVYLEGRKVQIRNPRDAIKKGIVLLSEDRKVNGYVPTLDIAGNISLASINKISNRYIMQKEKEKEFALQYIRQLSIKVRDERDNVLNLSGGNQQKVVLAKWLMTEPRVLLLDEPTRGIDVGAKSQIYQIMSDLAKQGIAIVMISSELPELVGMCDRFIVLSEGRQKAELGREDADEEKFLRIATSG